MSDLLLASTNLSTRAINILARNNILTLSQLKECSEKELRSMRGLGGKTLDEIVTFRDNPLDEETADETMNAEGMFCVALTPEILNSLSYHQITEIDMSARGFHYLTLMGCTTIAQLVRLKREDFQKTANIGEKTIEIIEESTKKWLLENGYYGDGSVLQTIPNADAESSTNTIFGRILTSEMRTSLSFHNVSELNLSSRAANALIRGNYITLDKIAELSIPKLTATKGIGLNTVNDIITQTRNWLTVNSYYESENFNISDNEKDLFEKLHSAFHFFLSVNPLQLLDACRKEAGYSSLIESYNGEITGCVISKFLEISFVRESIKEWFRQTSTSIGEGTESMPEEKFAEIIYNRIEEQYAQLLLNSIKESGIFTVLYDTVLIPRKTLSEYIHNLESSDDPKEKMLAERLHGAALQDVGERYGLTRERIRQIAVKQLKKCPSLFEDYYADVFQKYLLGKDTLKEIFPETTPETHQYLSMRYKKGHSIPEYESGEDFHGTFAGQVRYALKKIARRKNLTRASAVSYVLKHDCLNLVDFEQFQHKYNAYIEWLNVPPEKYSLNWRSLANRLRLQKNLVFESDGRFRYLYYDNEKLKNLIDFNRYKNSVVSCELIYSDYASELDEMDIQNGYELFCCLKNGDADEKDPAKKLSQRYPFDIIFRRIPVAIIGTVTEEEQVVTLLKELSPIGYMDFWTAYEERFGIKRDSALANLGNCATPYLVNGTYIIDVPMLDASDVEIVRNELNKKKFWFIDELETLWKQLCIHSSRDSLNAATLRSLGYLMFAAGYAYSNQYNSMRDYLYDEQIRDGEVFKCAEQDQRLVHLSAFQSCLSKEESALRIFEIAPREYVKDKYLFEQCGVTREDVVEFQQQVKPLCQNVYFNAHSIWDEIKDWPFVKMVESNEWLCNSIIHRIDGIVALPIASNFILSFSGDCLSIPFICKWITNKEGKMSLNDITSRFNSVFGTTFNRSVIAEKLRSSGMWSQIITDEIDGYIDSLADNSNFDVDSLLDEEFF